MHKNQTIIVIAVLRPQGKYQHGESLPTGLQIQGGDANAETERSQGFIFDDE